MAHNAAFPRYHFLPYPSVEEMQASRLAALAARPYGEICFPPEVTAQLVYVHRKAAFSLIDTPKGRIPMYDTSLLSGYTWREDGQKELFFQLRIVSATPCCSFWLAAAPGQLHPQQQLPAGCCFISLSPFRRPLLVPGPFPKTVRVQCRKKEKKPSRITQSCLKLKGAAATAAASQGPTAAIAASRGQHLSDAGKGDRHAATDGQEGFRAANEVGNLWLLVLLVLVLLRNCPLAAPESATCVLGSWCLVLLFAVYKTNRRNTTSSGSSSSRTNHWAVSIPRPDAGHCQTAASAAQRRRRQQ